MCSRQTLRYGKFNIYSHQHTLFLPRYETLRNWATIFVESLVDEVKLKCPIVGISSLDIYGTASLDIDQLL